MHRAPARARCWTRIEHVFATELKKAALARYAHASAATRQLPHPGARQRTQRHRHTPSPLRTHRFHLLQTLAVIATWRSVTSLASLNTATRSVFTGPSGHFPRAYPARRTQEFCLAPTDHRDWLQMAARHQSIRRRNIDKRHVPASAGDDGNAVTKPADTVRTLEAGDMTSTNTSQAEGCPPLSNPQSSSAINNRFNGMAASSLNAAFRRRAGSSPRRPAM